MTKIKRPLHILLCTLFIAALFSGCNYKKYLEKGIEMINEAIVTDEEEKLEISKNIINCFMEQDTEKLKDVFCANTQGLADIDEQISKGFDFIEGNIISFNEDQMLGSEGKSVSYGVYHYIRRSWHINEVTTDSGNVYRFYVYEYIISERDSGKEGITYITIQKDEDREDSITIGYSWPSYSYEGSQLSYDIIKKFDARDSEGLMNMFCPQSRQIPGIEGQIQDAFKFYNGEATFGVVGENKYGIIYDGDHDFKETVKDYVTIEKNNPTNIYIDVVVVNIETDTGNVYNMKFYSYLLCEDNKSHEGISQIIFADDSGNEFVIGEKIDFTE